MSSTKNGWMLPSFELLEPKTLRDASCLLARYGDDAKVLAGGTDLFVQMRNGKVSPKYMISLMRIRDLDYLRYEEKAGLRIGATCAIRSLEKSSIVKQAYRAVHEAAYSVGTVQVRNMATLAGNICNASPAADMAPPLMVFGAELEIVGRDGKKSVALENFFTGPKKTALARDEVLAEIRLPDPPLHSGSAFLKISRTGSDLAKINGAAMLVVHGGVCIDVKIALGAVASTPIRVTGSERTLKGKRLEDSLLEKTADIAVDEISPISDVRSSEEYRRQVSKILVKRMLRAALERIDCVPGGKAI